MEVWVFGNPDLAADALPLRLLPELQRAFPKLRFKQQDPLEEWPTLPRLVIIDTVRGLKRVRAFTTLDDFTAPPHVTMHDFDLATELRLRAKLNQLPPFVILGVPPELNEAEALAQLKPLLQQYAA